MPKAKKLPATTPDLLYVKKEELGEGAVCFYTDSDPAALFDDTTPDEQTLHEYQYVRTIKVKRSVTIVD